MHECVSHPSAPERWLRSTTHILQPVPAIRGPAVVRGRNGLGESHWNLTGQTGCHIISQRGGNQAGEPRVTKPERKSRIVSGPIRDVVKAALKRVIAPRFRPVARAAYRKIRYFGFSYKCPFCGSGLRRLFPFGSAMPVLTQQRVVGGGWRPNSVCPVCGSFDRERLLYLYLLHESDLFTKPVRLLHVAPEERLKRILSRSSNIHYVSADLLALDVMVRMDITRIPLPDASFDVILCNHVLEHIVDDQRALGELLRVLKPGGWSILQVPISLALQATYEDFLVTTPHGREEAFGQNDHVRIYARDYDARLSGAGFQVEVFRWAAKAEKFGGGRNLFSLIVEERIYVARKPGAI